jgi:membrane associated rhomboid family serine protease
MGRRSYVESMIPYRDENSTERVAVITLVLIGLNVLVWLLAQGAGATRVQADGSVTGLAASVCNLGLIPGELMLRVRPGTGFEMGNGLICAMDEGRQWSHVFTSMFLHGSWMHLLFNMWFLWLFGNNVEDSMGRGRFVVFYLLSGIGGAVFQVAANPASPLPMVGASGAISGVMGAYIVLYPRVKVYTLIPIGFFLTTIALPAWAMLGYWILLQVLPVLTGAGNSGGTAFWAHIGGFVVGAGTIRLFARPDYIARRCEHLWAPQRIGWRR